MMVMVMVMAVDTRVAHTEKNRKHMVVKVAFLQGVILGIESIGNKE